MKTCYYIFDETKKLMSVRETIEFCQSKNLDTIEQPLNFAYTIFNYLNKFERKGASKSQVFFRDREEFNPIPAGK